MSWYSPQSQKLDFVKSIRSPVEQIDSPLPLWRKMRSSQYFFKNHFILFQAVSESRFWTPSGRSRSVRAQTTRNDFGY